MYQLNLGVKVTETSNLEMKSRSLNLQVMSRSMNTTNVAERQDSTEVTKVGMSALCQISVG